jgi:hypothetical protein
VSIDRLHAFASRWFDRATVTGVFEPMLADWQREWFDATPSRRRWIVMRGYAAFVATAIVSWPRAAFAPIPGRLARRIAIKVCLFCACVAAAEAGIYLWDPTAYHDAALFVPPASWPYVLPSLLTLALPFAMVPGVDAIRCFEDLPDHLQRRAGLKLVFAATLWMVIGGGWLVPAANQQWRVEVAAANPALRDRPPLKGARELTTPELFVASDAQFPLIRGGERQREINLRLSLAILPLLLVWMRWRLLTQGSQAWGVSLSASVIGVGVFAGYFLLVAFDGMVEARLGVRPGFGLWPTLVVFALAGLAEQRRRRRRSTAAQPQ